MLFRINVCIKKRETCPLGSHCPVGRSVTPVPTSSFPRAMTRGSSAAVWLPFPDASAQMARVTTKYKAHI